MKPTGGGAGIDVVVGATTTAVGATIPAVGATTTPDGAAATPDEGAATIEVRDRRVGVDGATGGASTDGGIAATGPSAGVRAHV